MLVLVTYDVNTEDSAGRKRLRHVAKICTNYGQRVQNSVFECNVDAGQYKLLKNALMEEMDSSKDSIRFYELGNKYYNHIEHVGVKESFDMEGVLII